LTLLEPALDGLDTVLTRPVGTLTRRERCQAYRRGLLQGDLQMDLFFLVLIAVLSAVTIGLVYGLERLRGRK
jgi:hypothetical protein